MTNKAKQLGWEKHTDKVYEYADCYWQKKIDGYFFEVVQYSMKDVLQYQLRTQFEDSVIGVTLDLSAFSYDTLDWERFESDAKTLVKLLAKKAE